MPMKLSEAILLGSTVSTARAGGLRFPGTDERCALGMAAIAQACTFARATRPLPRKDQRTLNAEDVWGDWLLRVVMRTCDCPPRRVQHQMRVKDVIAHLFDYHVMEKRDWTLDQLVTWVQTWEPKVDPSGDLSPEILERLSQSQTAYKSRGEEELRDAGDWKERVSAFEDRHKSQRRRGGSTA
jgi:hypothetical protein